MIKSLVSVCLLFTLGAQAQCPPMLEEAVSIVFVGNSITRHPPAPEIGWNNDWGMAAEKPSSDYVAKVRLQLAQRFEKVRGTTVSIVAFEKGAEDGSAILNKVEASHPQMLIIQGGDNIDKSPEGKLRFVDRYGALLSSLRKKYGECTPIVCVGPWFSAGTDARQSDACRAAGAPFVSLRNAYADPSMHAESSYPNAAKGVRAHPNDKAMSFIADAVVEALVNR